MVENIKSNFFVRYLFSFLDDVKQLYLVKYNKRLQKLLNINIMNYRFFNGKYIEYDRNGIGKIYDCFSNNLIFEGEFINGKKNGKGKEFDNNGNLIFEGEYLNNKRNGKGKEYFSVGNVKFEGEYLNGRKWNGKGYNKYNIQMFEIKNGN